MIRTSIVGLGDISSVHLQAIKSLPGACLTAACDIDPEKKKLLKDDVHFYTDMDRMLAEEKPDCVHICLPHYLHYPAALKAAQAGVNIFAEKPLAMDMDEARKYMKLEEAYGVKICISLQNRVNPTTICLKQMLDSGDYGAVTGMRGVVTWYRNREYFEVKPWRGSMKLAGGGCMMNQSVHTLDLMQYLAGSPISQIHGNVGQILDYGIEVEDTAVARIQFENGAAGLFMASIGNFDNQAVILDVRTEKAEFSIREGCLFQRLKGEEKLLASDEPPKGVKFYYGSGHGKLIRDFYSLLDTGEGALISPREAAASICMIESIVKSSRTGLPVPFEKLWNGD